MKREVIQIKREQIDFLKRELQSLQKDENSQMADYVVIGGGTIVYFTSDYLQGI